MFKCSYCGNTSGKRDSFGGCISCGAQLQELPFAQIDKTARYADVSGSISTYFGYQIGYGQYTVNEIRDRLELPRFEGSPQEQIVQAIMEEPSNKWIKFQ